MMENMNPRTYHVRKIYKYGEEGQGVSFSMRIQLKMSPAVNCQNIGPKTPQKGVRQTTM